MPSSSRAALLCARQTHRKRPEVASGCSSTQFQAKVTDTQLGLQRRKCAPKAMRRQHERPRLGRLYANALQSAAKRAHKVKRADLMDATRFSAQWSRRSQPPSNPPSERPGASLASWMVSTMCDSWDMPCGPQVIPWLDPNAPKNLRTMSSCLAMVGKGGTHLSELSARASTMRIAGINVCILRHGDGQVIRNLVMQSTPPC